LIKKNNLYIFGQHSSGVFDADPNPLGTYFLSNSYGRFIEKIDSSGNLKWVKEIELSCFDIDENANFTYVLKWVQSSTPQDTLMLFSIDSIGILKTEIMPLTNRGDSSSTYSSNIAQILLYKNHFIVTGNFNLSFTIDSTINCNVTSAGDLDIMIAKIVDCNVLPTSNYTIAPDLNLAHNWLTANLSTNASSYLWHWDDGSQPTSGMNAQHTYASPNNYNICLTAIATNGCHSTYCDSSTYIYRMKNGKSMISVNAIASGVNAINKKYEFEIYPNPTNNQLIVDSKISINNLEITDLSGRILVNHSNPNSNIVNVENLNNGIYFLKITTQNKEMLQVKFVKE
jgi:PKD repeat protein